MKSQIAILALVATTTLPAFASTSKEIARIDRVMIRTCQVAEIDHQSARRNAIEAFLRILPHLERQYKNTRNNDGVLACQKARAKYDPTAEKINRPTGLHDQLIKMESSLQAQLEKLDRIKRDKIKDANSARVRKLTAIQRGLVKRGDTEGSRLIVTALKTTPTVPKAKPTEEKAVKATDYTYLTYNRPQRRWVKFDGAGVKRTVAHGVTTLTYAEGQHWLLKVLWPKALNAGDHFSIEVKGAFSVELIALDGHDANAHFSMPKSDGFVRVNIARTTDGIEFTCNGLKKTTKYMSGRRRGDEAKEVVLSTPLRAVFSIKKEQSASFRNAKFH